MRFTLCSMVFFLTLYLNSKGMEKDFLLPLYSGSTRIVNWVSTSLRYMRSNRNSEKYVGNERERLGYATFNDSSLRAAPEIHPFIDPLAQENGQALAWRLILQEAESSSSGGFYQRATHTDLQRVAALLCEASTNYTSSHEATLPASTIRSLRLIKIIERMIDKKKLSLVAKALLYRKVCSLKNCDALKKWQCSVKAFLGNRDSESIVSIFSELMDNEKFFVGFLVQEAVSDDEKQALIATLNFYFPKASTDVFNFILHTPIAQLLKNDMLRLRQEEEAVVDFRETYTKGLYYFLEDLVLLARYINEVAEGKSVLRPLVGELLKPFTYNLQKLLKDFSQSETEDANFSFYKIFSFIFENRAALLRVYEALGHIEVLHFLAEVQASGYCFADYKGTQERPIITIKNGWYPLLDKPVTFSSSLGTEEERAYIVTGPNGAGKSVFLLSVGASAVLALTLGIAPASELAISLFDHVLTSFSVHDSLAAGLSTYQAQLQSIKEIRDIAFGSKKACLVILDEPVNSTDPALIEALIKTILEELGQQGSSIALLATHYTLPLRLVECAPKIYKHYTVTDHYIDRAKEHYE